MLDRMKEYINKGLTGQLGTMNAALVSILALLALIAFGIYTLVVIALARK